MVVLSCLRPSLQAGARALISASSRRLPQLAIVPKQLGQIVPVRLAHKHMIVKPSSWDYEVLKDQLHFFFLLGLIPIGVTVFCTTVFVGDAELADIPEDYYPKPWEYCKDPIERFISRYVYFQRFMERDYEKTLHMIYVNAEAARFNLLEVKVKKLSKERKDFKGWYYTPSSTQRIDANRKQREIIAASSSRSSFLKD